MTDLSGGYPSKGAPIPHGQLPPPPPGTAAGVVDERCHLKLTPEQAQALYDWMESDDCPNWWETPLAAIHAEIGSYLRYEAPWTVPAKETTDG